ncbi:MAG: twin-arginine translocase subunit TatC [Planctomycetota bacterium]
MPRRRGGQRVAVGAAAGTLGGSLRWGEALNSGAMALDQVEVAKQGSDFSMPLGDHLEELRRRLVYAGIGVVVAAAVTLSFGFKLIGWLAQPLLQAQDAMGFPTQTLVLDPTAGFTSVYLPVSLIAAVLLASPWVIYQAWKFISVGLYHHERKAVYLLTPFSTVMTGLAVGFTYYVLLPVSLMFFFQFAARYPSVDLTSPNPVMRVLLDAYGPGAGLNEADRAADPAAPTAGLPRFPVLDGDPAGAAEGGVWINAREGKLKAVVHGAVRVVGLQSDRLISPMPALGEYVRFAAMMMLGVTLAFQLPVVMLVAGWTNLFDPRAVASLRKYALFGAFAAGAILTPTDLFSMLVLALPLYLLFELGLVVMKLAVRKPAAAPDEL